MFQPLMRAALAGHQNRFGAQSGESLVVVAKIEVSLVRESQPIFEFAIIANLF
jgi:hypothetical protein